MVLVWGANLTIIKVALRNFLPITFNCLRFLIASTAIALLNRDVFRDSLSRRELLGLVVLGVLGNTIYQLLFIYGISFSHVTHVAILLGVSPIMTAALSRIFKVENVSGRVWTGILLSFAGVLLIVFGGGDIGGTGNGKVLLGDALVVVGCLSWSAYTTFSRPLIDSYSSRHYTTYTLIFGALFLLPFGVPGFLSQDWHALTRWDWLGLFYSALLALVFGYSCWYYAVERLGSTRTSIYSNLNPVASLVIGLLFLDERLSLLQWAGAAVIFTGLILNRMSSAPVSPEA